MHADHPGERTRPRVPFPAPSPETNVDPPAPATPEIASPSAPQHPAPGLGLRAACCRFDVRSLLRHAARSPALKVSKNQGRIIDSRIIKEARVLDSGFLFRSKIKNQQSSLVNPPKTPVSLSSSRLCAPSASSAPPRLSPHSAPCPSSVGHHICHTPPPQPPPNSPIRPLPFRLSPSSVQRFSLSVFQLIPTQPTDIQCIPIHPTFKIHPPPLLHIFFSDSLIFLALPPLPLFPVPETYECE